MARESQLNVLVSEKEKRMIDDAAKARHLKTAAYVRSVLLTDAERTLDGQNIATVTANETKENDE